MACRAVASATTEAAWELFCTASQAYGLPVMALSDNGLAFSGKLRGFEVAFERNLRELGVRAVTSRPYHPQTCGKIERFHQTLKKWLRAQHWVWADLEAFQCALDRFREFYNERRPHRALGGHTPGERYRASPPAAPPGIAISEPLRVSTMTVGSRGLATSKTWSMHIGVDYVGRSLTVASVGDRMLVTDGTEIVRSFVLDRSRHYQASGRKRGGRTRRS